MNIYIGYDHAQNVAYDVCKYSITKNTHIDNLEINKIDCNTVDGYERPDDPLASTPFTYARFYVPYINNYKGFSIFCDGDFLFLDDISTLIDVFDSNYAVQVVKHDYSPLNTMKMDNKIQSLYPRKNWSSLILWNNEHPKNKRLDLKTLNAATGSFLHQFKWLDDNDIGEVSYKWNWLVGWYKQTGVTNPKALHFTEGGPWLDEYKNCEYSDIWLKYKNEMCIDRV